MRVLAIPRAPRFEGYMPSSAKASAAARAASRRRDTQCELALRRALWALGLRYRVDVRQLPGKPDIVFRRLRIAIFCDGDFWHGRDLGARIRRLSRGHNAPYWVAKIRRNVERDATNTRC
jgi:DNA mismatch endonuclease (patch repair protein)